MHVRQRLQDAISALELSYRMSKLEDNLPLPVSPGALDVLLPLALDPAVLHKYLGAEGAATVLALPPNKTGKFDKRAHLYLTPEDRATQDYKKAVDQELDKWFDAFSNGRDYQ